MTCPPLLYLDYDGVLHHEDVVYSPKTGPRMRAPGQEMFAHAPLLAEILTPYPALRIVLSTSWSILFTTEKAAGFLPAELRERVIGRTLPATHSKRGFRAMNRGQQILKDVARRGATAWIAIDDDAKAFPPEARNHLVSTHPSTGLGDPLAVQCLKQKLSAANAAWSNQ